MARINIPNLQDLIGTMANNIQQYNSDFKIDPRSVWYLMVGYPVARLGMQKLYKLQYIADKMNIYKCEGIELDDILNGNFNFPRKQPSYSKLYITFTAVNGTVVGIGELGVKTETGIEFFNINTSTTTGGLITLEFECEETGTVGNIETNTITSFITTVAGILSIQANTEGEGGQDQETDIQYRDRWFNARFRAFWNIDGIRSALLNLDGVKSVYVDENDEPEEVEGIEMKSVVVVIDGGIDQQIGETIFLKKDQAIKSVGDKSVLVTDISGIQREIKFFRPSAVEIEAQYTTIPAEYSNNNKNKLDSLIKQYIDNAGIHALISAYECFTNYIRENISETELKHMDLLFKRKGTSDSFLTSIQLGIKEKGEYYV